MDAESWFNARKAVELGFADGILFMEDESFPSEFEVSGGMIFSRQAVTNSILQKLKSKEKPKGTPIESLEKRLFLLLPH
jgi:ATP-dependent Clp protease, protease subunit